MYTEVEISNFKSLAHVHLKPGRFNLFVGPNGSGKSNFLDALRVLQGVASGFSVDEVFNGRARSATTAEWEGIRGGGRNAGFFPRNGRDDEAVIRFAVGVAGHSVHPGRHARYGLTIQPIPERILGEELECDGQQVFASDAVRFNADSFEGAEFLRRMRLDTVDLMQSLLPRLARRETPESLSCQFAIDEMTDLQRFEPVLAVLRDYSQAHSVRRMGDRGEYFATVVRQILEDDGQKAAYLGWLQQLTPAEMDDVIVLKGALGEPLFATVSGGRQFPAPVLSDGTLRFAAYVALFFQPEMPKVLMIEEIENGIHPTRLRLLLELLKSQSAATGTQIMATTHSPIVLAWLEEEDYGTTFVCQRDEESGATSITPLSEIPYLLDIVRRRSLGELFAEGWLEAVA